jgi:MSHA biogenesis protein MshE
MVASSVHAVVAQRLLRVICESCHKPHVPDSQERGWLSVELGADYDASKLARGAGCSHCNGTGFAGRTGIYELLEMTPELVQAAHRHDSEGFTRHAHRLLEGQTLKHQALKLALAGRTTLAEALRVASQTED